MSFAANEDVTTLFEPASATNITERPKLHSGGIEAGSTSLSGTPTAGKKSVRDIGVGSGKIGGSAASMSMLSGEQRS